MRTGIGNAALCQKVGTQSARTHACKFTVLPCKHDVLRTVNVREVTNDVSCFDTRPSFCSCFTNCLMVNWRREVRVSGEGVSWSHSIVCFCSSVTSAPRAWLIALLCSGTNCQLDFATDVFKLEEPRPIRERLVYSDCLCTHFFLFRVTLKCNQSQKQ
jgi:hypothetical protein